jgi:hypothetical protein
VSADLTHPLGEWLVFGSVPPDFCTLFDSKYLVRGLALYASLQEVEPRAQLRAFCMDERAYDVLKRLELPRLTAISLDDLERHDPRLAAVKADRTQLEYCWTATPCIAQYCLDREPDLEAITYVDSDIYFFSRPEPLFAEFGDNSIQIVPHRYAPEHRHMEPTSGIYNVEWVTFKRDQRGLEALDWWRERCLEWCYYREEDGKLGDQKYLDDWPDRFQGVSVLQHLGGGLAPWNVSAYTLSERDGRVWVDDLPLIFYHYHSLKLFHPPARRIGRRRSTPRAAPSGSFFWTSNYPPSRLEERLVWEPYLAAVNRAFQLARTVDPEFAEGLLTSEDFARRSLRVALGQVVRDVLRLPTNLHLREPESGSMAPADGD